MKRFFMWFWGALLAIGWILAAVFSVSSRRKSIQMVRREAALKRRDRQDQYTELEKKRLQEVESHADRDLVVRLDGLRRKRSRPS